MTEQVDIPRGPLGAAVKRVQSWPHARWSRSYPCSATDDVRRDDGRRGDGRARVDENGRRIFAALNGPTYPVDWPPRR
jgi:hypothetical protein